MEGEEVKSLEETREAPHAKSNLTTTLDDGKFGVENSYF